VAGYTITVTPSDDAGPQTTIRVDTDSGSARIIELTVRAVEGNGLSAQELPALNLDQLIAALTPQGPTAITATPNTTGSGAATPGPEATSTQPASTEPAEAAGTPASEAAQEPATPAPAARGRSRAKKAARKAPASKAPSRTRQAKAEQPSNGRRAYRRMPEPAEVLAAYREVGGTTALARHYGVPRHTATGWLRRLRSQGLLEA